MSEIKYIGCFFEFEGLQKQLESYPRTPLKRVVEHPHVTFAYKPQQVPKELFGTKVEFRVVGYGCNGQNEGLKVEFVDPPRELLPLIRAIPVPHITLSVAERGEAVNSSQLEFTPITPFTLTGVFGGMDMDKKVWLIGE